MGHCMAKESEPNKDGIDEQLAKLLEDHHDAETASIEVRQLAHITAVFYMTMVRNGVPQDDALTLTATWLETAIA